MPYTVRVIRCKSNNKSYRLKDLQGITLYIFVNLTVSRKSLAAFLMSAHLSNDVRILHALVQVTAKCSACHMAAGTFANRHTDLTPRGRIQHSHHAVDSSQPKDLLDGIIIFLFRDEREDSCPSRRFISFQYLLCHCDKRHGYGLGIIILRLACYIVKNITFYIRPSHTIQVTYTTADTTLEYEYISLNGQCWTIRKVKVSNLAQFLCRYIDRSSINRFRYRELSEWRCRYISRIKAPVEECSQTGKHIYDCILASGLRLTLLRYDSIYVRVCIEMLMFISKELP